MAPDQLHNCSSLHFTITTPEGDNFWLRTLRLTAMAMLPADEGDEDIEGQHSGRWVPCGQGMDGVRGMRNPDTI